MPAIDGLLAAASGPLAAALGPLARPSRSARPRNCPNLTQPPNNTKVNSAQDRDAIPRKSPFAGDASEMAPLENWERTRRDWRHLVLLISLKFFIRMDFKNFLAPQLIVRKISKETKSG